MQLDAHVTDNSLSFVLIADWKVFLLTRAAVAA